MLTLLLSAKGDWEGAGKAGEAGVGVWEVADEEEEEELEGGNGGERMEGVEARDFAAPEARSTTSPQPMASQPILSSSGTPLPFPPSPSNTNLVTPKGRQTRLSHVIQLRMTLNIIAEKTLGCEVAMWKQQELFAFFSARSGDKGRTGGNGTGRGLVGSSSFVSEVGGGQGLEGSYISVEPPRERESGPASMIPGEHYRSRES